jgi:PAS domain S-box-containing protein
MNKKNIIFKPTEGILKLKFLAKEKESIMLKLVLVAKQLAKTAKEKESVRKKLALTAKQLVVIAKEKENIRRKLVVTAEKFRLKAEELAVTIVKQEAILASIGDAVMACDKEGRIILFNRKAVAVTGFSTKVVMGKHYNHLVKFVRESDNKPSEDFIAEAMKTGHKTTMANNTLLVKKDGSKIPVADSAEPIRYMHQMLIGCVVIFRDITKEKETDKAKNEFIAIASHQLKTPTTIVNLYTEMLLDDSDSVLTLTQKENINEIRGANQRMIDIVGALLNVSRIEMGISSVNLVPVDVITILKNVIKSSQINIKEKQIILQEKYHQSECMIPIDALLLNMIFSNLISNSIRYTSAGGTISVKSLQVKKGEKISNNIIKENSLLVSVSDNGCGIPIDQQYKVFTKFFRSDNARNQHTDGTGLGLYIVKSILGHIGGDVWFSSKEEGTIFYFTIPLNKRKHNI